MPEAQDNFVIFSYPRRQALEDGVLVDVTPTARDGGFRYPVAVTRAVWDQVIAPDDASRAIGQSEEGRLWDVLWTLRLAIHHCPRNTDHLQYELLVLRDGQTTSLVTLKALCGPDDDGSPCLTILLPEED